jgi:hypothetical protein
MGSSKSSTPSNTTSTNFVRFAPYIEEAHIELLEAAKDYATLIISNSPFYDYSSQVDYATPFDFTDALYGAGYAIDSFPSLYDMFGKFMGGMDIEALWQQTITGVQSNVAVTQSIYSHYETQHDLLNQRALPEFEAGARDVNAVMSSYFAIGRSQLYDSLIRQTNEYASGLRYKLLPVAVEVFNRHLGWNQEVVKTYLEVMKAAIQIESDTRSYNMDIMVKDRLWPFTILDNYTNIISAMTGAKNESSEVKGSQSGPSKTSSAIGGMLSGAAAGASIPGAGVFGAAIGGVLGLAAGLFG